MSSLFQDVRFAFRGLIRNPGFALTTILILALGFGANSTMFTVVNALFFEPPPGIRDASGLVRINRSNERTRAASMSYPDFDFYRQNNEVFEGFTGYTSGLTPLTAELDGRIVPVEAQLVAGNLFDVLGVTFSEGRGFLPEEDRVPGEAAVVIVSHSFRERELGGISIGQTISLNGRPFELVGVVGPAFRQVGPTDGSPDVWMPLMMRSAVFQSSAAWTQRVQGESDSWIEGFARLAPGVNVAAARADMSRLASQLEDTYAEWSAGQGVSVQPDFQYNPSVRDRLSMISRMLVAVALVVLLIACANVAILMLSRASARQREFGVRVALGASRVRLLRQLLVESSVLAGLGAAAGLVIASWASGVAGAMIPLSLNLAFEPDLTVIGMTMGAAAAATLLFGLMPAWLASRPDVVETIKGTVTARRRSLVRHTLVVTQVALAILLVTGAGLFVQSLQSAQGADLGFATNDRVTLQVNLRNHGYTTSEGKVFVREAVQRLAAMPGVLSATSTTRYPLTRGVWSGSFQVPGVQPPDGQAAFDAGFNAVGPGYFTTLGIPMVRGREFTHSDDDTAPAVVILNELLARQIWGAEDPLGRIIRRGTTELTVVGVARQSMYYTLGEDPTTQMYFPELQVYQPAVTFALHTSLPPEGFVQPARTVLQGLDRTLAVSGAQTAGQLLRSVTQRYRTNAMVLSLFGMLALALAALGLYGVLAYTVAQQTRDIGIRMALGAGRTRLAWLVVGLGLRLVLLGVAIGGAISWWLSESFASLLFEITPRDPLTFSLVPLILIAVAIVASYLPARRASHIDPMEALRLQ